ncbi:hypothetical protein SGLAM104S_01714 [Streptomyces glaucescens]
MATAPVSTGPAGSRPVRRGGTGGAGRGRAPGAGGPGGSGGRGRRGSRPGARNSCRGLTAAWASARDLRQVGATRRAACSGPPRRGPSRGRRDGSVRDEVDLRCQPCSTPLASNGSRLSSRTVAGGGPADALVRGAVRGVRRAEPRSPGVRARAPTGWWAPLGRPGQGVELRRTARSPARPAAAAGPVGGRPPAAGERVRVRCGVEVRGVRTERGCRGEGGGDQPRRVQPAPAEVLQAGRSGDPPGLHRGLGPAGVRVASGGESAVGEDEECCARHQKRK